MKARKFFWKRQTKYVRRAAELEMRSHDEVIGIGVWPEIGGDELRERLPALVFLTPHEAMAAAAWLSENAERMIARDAKAAARKAARLAAKEAQQ